MSSGDHELIGRIYDLGVVELNFETYEELSAFSDCKYVSHCGVCMRRLVRRVESLNLAGDLMWVDPVVWEKGEQRIDRYAWLNVAADVFLIRLVSVHDCLLLFVSEIYETDLEPRQCTEGQLKKRGVPNPLLELLRSLRDGHQALRFERNSRVHQGWERTYSSCDESFKAAANFERFDRQLKGIDSVGRRINLNRYMKEGLVELQRDHNKSLRILSKRLNQVYDFIQPEFESRFRTKFRDPEMGFGYSQKLIKP